MHTGKTTRCQSIDARLSRSRCNSNHEEHSWEWPVLFEKHQHYVSELSPHIKPPLIPLYSLSLWPQFPAELGSQGWDLNSVTETSTNTRGLSTPWAHSKVWFVSLMFWMNELCCQGSCRARSGLFYAVYVCPFNKKLTQEREDTFIDVHIDLLSGKWLQEKR